jgi:hypothetical protein
MGGRGFLNCYGYVTLKWMYSCPLFNELHFSLRYFVRMQNGSHAFYVFVTSTLNVMPIMQAYTCTDD